MVWSNELWTDSARLSGLLVLSGYTLKRNNCFDCQSSARRLESEGKLTEVLK